MLKRVTVSLLSLTLEFSGVSFASTPPGGGPSDLSICRESRLRQRRFAVVIQSEEPGISDGFDLTSVGSPGFCNPVLVPRSAVPPLPPASESVFADTRSVLERSDQFAMMDTVSDLTKPFSSLAIRPEE